MDQTMQEVDKIPLEKVQNYMRLQNLLCYVGLPLLREIFISNWKTIYDSEWTNSNVNGIEFVRDIAKTLFHNAGKIQKKLLKSGDINKWDLPLVIDALKCLQESRKINTEQNKWFTTLKEIRNQLNHLGGLEIDNELFEKMWQSVSKVLLSLGTPQSDMDKAKTASVHENKANTEKALRLRREGNLHVQNNNFIEALKKYSEAISQPGLPSNELSMLYSNRSHVHLQQGNVYEAKEDAKGAILLNPKWWKGYSRLGHAYLKVEKYEEALNKFEKAMTLNPRCKLESERDHCRNMKATVSRYEHLDPMNHDTKFDEFMDNVYERSPNLAKDIAAMRHSLNKSYLPMGMCTEGHKFLRGQGVQQSYKKAAEWFANAAAKGSAEGLYNLALLTLKGEGVERNVPKSIKLMELAASQDIYTQQRGLKVPNIGVVEAQHSLGLFHSDGVGLPQNYQKALDWYTKAIKNGSGLSANNIGFMYNCGIGVPQNREMALNYYKLASTMKTVRAMENVAKVYLILLNKTESQKWFRYAISKGSLDLQTRKEDFLKLVGAELEKPIEDDVFELELLEEVRTGSLSLLIPEGWPLSPYEIVASYSRKTDVGDAGEETMSLTPKYRDAIITKHRILLREANKKNFYYTNCVEVVPKPMADLSSFKPINFNDMNFKRDQTYEGFVIKLNLIEDAITGEPSISQIAEDDNGHAQRVVINNFVQNDETQNVLGFGCKITVVNPNVKLDVNGESMVCVDDISLMVLHSHSTNKKRCRYCGMESGPTVRCGKCKRSFYCSKLCLERDLTELNHNDVCLKQL